MRSGFRLLWPLALFLACPTWLLRHLRVLSFQFLGGMFRHLAILPDNHRRPSLPGSLDDFGCGLPKGGVGLLREAVPGLGAHGAMLRHCDESGRTGQRPQSSGFPRPWAHIKLAPSLGPVKGTPASTETMPDPEGPCHG